MTGGLSFSFLFFVFTTSSRVNLAKWLEGKRRVIGGIDINVVELTYYSRLVTFHGDENIRSKFACMRTCKFTAILVTFAKF